MKSKNLWIGIIFLILFLLPVNSVAEEEIGEDMEIYGLELEKVLNLGSGILAAVLFVIAQIAYARTGNKRLQYVGLAFILFAIKGFLTSSELFFPEWSWVDPTASVLDFIILLVFFFGIVKK